MFALTLDAAPIGARLLSRLSRRAAAALLVLAPASRGAAQIQPVGFGARVHVDSAVYRGDHLVIGYSASNSATSPQPLWGLAVETPVAPVTQNDLGTKWLLNVGPFAGKPSAVWMALGSAKVAPGGTTPPLVLDAVGVPGIVSYWVVAYTPPKQTDDPDREPDEDPMLQRSIAGTTVGIVPVPDGATPASLTSRLRTLLGRSCGDLGWISQPGVCHSLDEKLAHAEGALADGTPDVARGDLTAFTNELDAQHGPEPGKHVGDAAYALLSANVAYLLSHL